MKRKKLIVSRKIVKLIINYWDEIEMEWKIYEGEKTFGDFFADKLRSFGVEVIDEPEVK